MNHASIIIIYSIPENSAAVLTAKQRGYLGGNPNKSDRFEQMENLSNSSTPQRSAGVEDTESDMEDESMKPRGK